MRRSTEYRAVILVLLAGLAAAPLCAQAAPATTLKDISVSKQPLYVEVKLSFDKKPAYTESLRFDPHRYLLTLTGCKSAVPKAATDKLAKLDGELLEKISLRGGAENVELGFQLSLAVHPFIRFDETSYTLRFYSGTRVERTTTLAPGLSVTEKSVTRGGENLQAYIVRVDPGADVDVYSAAADRYDRSTRVRGVSSFARKENAEVVINGGFFGAKGQHLSTLVEDGVMRASGVIPTRPMIVITRDGEALLGRYNVITALTFTGSTGKIQSLTVNAKNYPFESGKTMVYDQTYPIDTLPQEAMFYYLITGGRMLFIGSDTKKAAMQPGTLLLATDIMPEVNPLKQIPPDSQVNLETRITNASGQTILAQSAIGGAPMLVEDGAIDLSVAQDKVKDDIAKSERSRTAVGLTRSGQLMLVVVKEAEASNYGGLTLKALAQLMLDEGALQAMNLDGGGSSAIAVAGHLMNLDARNERAVSNVLVVKARQPRQALTPLDKGSTGGNKYEPTR